MGKSKVEADFLAWSEAAESSLNAAAGLLAAARSGERTAEQNAEDRYCELLRLADGLFPGNNEKSDRDELRAIAGKACSMLEPKFSAHQWPVASAHEWTQYMVHHLLGTVRMAAGLCPGLPGWEMMKKTGGEWSISIRSTECRSEPFFADVTGVGPSVEWGGLIDADREQVQELIETGTLPMRQGEITRERWLELREQHFAYSPDYNRGFRSEWKGRIEWQLANFPPVNFGAAITAVKTERASCGETVAKSLPAPPPALIVIRPPIHREEARDQLQAKTMRLAGSKDRFAGLVNHDGSSVMIGNPEEIGPLEEEAKEIVLLLLACGADISLSARTYAGRLCEWAHRQLLNRDSSITPDPGETNDLTEWKYPLKSIGMAIEAFLSMSSEQTKKTGRKAKPIEDFSDVPPQIQKFKTWLKKNKGKKHNRKNARVEFLLTDPLYDDTTIEKDEQALKQLVLYWSKFFE